MDFVYHSHMDLMLEALNYLAVKTGDTPAEATFSHLEMLYRQEGVLKPLQARIALMRQLYKAIDSRYTPDMKEIKPFFTPFSIGQGNIANMLMLSFYDPAITDWAQQEKHIREKFLAFAAAPSQPLNKLRLASLIEEYDDNDKKAQEASLLFQLEETGLKDEEKWHILRTIQNPGPQLTRLVELLLPVKALIDEKLPSLMPLLEDFKIRWERYFQANPFAAFLSKNIGMEAGNIDGYTLHIYPSLFHGGTITLNIEEETKSIYLQIGACLPEGLNAKAIPLETSHLLEGLKALSDKSKLSILSGIRNKSAYGQELARETGLSTATISHHMSALINCGFIHLERVENRIYYQMDKENIGLFLKKLHLYLIDGEGDGPLHP